MSESRINDQLIIKLIQEKNVKAEREYAEILVDFMSDAITSGMVNDLNNSFDKLAPKLEALCELTGLNEDPNMMNAYFLGIVKTLTELSSKLSSNFDITTEVQRIEHTDYGIKILEILTEYKTLNHSTIANKIGVTSHALSMFMKRMEDTNYWVKTKEGKYRNYYITPIGEQCHYAIKKSIGHTTPLLANDYAINGAYQVVEAIVESLISTTPNLNQIVHQLSSVIGNIAPRDEKFLRLKIRTLLNQTSIDELEFNRFIEPTIEDYLHKRPTIFDRNSLYEEELFEIDNELKVIQTNSMLHAVY